MVTTGPFVDPDNSSNPFLRYRKRLESYRRWVLGGRSDAAFIDLVVGLDAAVAEVEKAYGRSGFSMTPTSHQPALAESIGLPEQAQLWVKDETNNVSGSHKARHLFGLALHIGIDSSTGDGSRDVSELVIASCGNAALGAAVVAKAAKRDLRVFIPVWADEAVVSDLTELGAAIERCERREGEVGDPCYLRLREAVAAGSFAFSVQGADVPESLDGGRTIGWELAEQLSQAMGGPGHLDNVFVQTGGGALGASLAAGLGDGVDEGWIDSMPRVFAVQTTAAAPLDRAWRLLMASPDPSEVLRLGAGLDQYMWPWDEVAMSAATGILDDLTFDWVPLAKAMLASDGRPIVVTEDVVVAANEVGRRATGIDVDPTGTAGLAGLMATRSKFAQTDISAILFTGRLR